MSTDRWQAYVQALNAVHSERDQATAAGRLGRRARSDRAATLDSYGSRLTAQREALGELAGRLRVPLPAHHLAPEPVAALSWDLGVEDLDARLQQADDAGADARRLGQLPQFLPGWEGTLARSVVVLVGLSLPNAAFTIILSTAGVKGSNPLLLWFVLVFPLVLALGGGLVLARVSAPRTTPEGADGQPVSGWRPRWQHRLVAVPIAWASWLVPGALLDLLPLHLR